MINISINNYTIDNGDYVERHLIVGVFFYNENNPLTLSVTYVTIFLKRGYYGDR